MCVVVRIHLGGQLLRRNLKVYYAVPYKLVRLWYYIYLCLSYSCQTSFEYVSKQCCNADFKYFANIFIVDTKLNWWRKWIPKFLDLLPSLHAKKSEIVKRLTHFHIFSRFCVSFKFKGSFLRLLCGLYNRSHIKVKE